MATRKEQLEVGIVATDKASRVLGDVATQVDKLDGESASVDITADDQASDEIKLLLDALTRLSAEDAEVVLKARADDFNREMANALKQIGRVKDQDHLDILISAKNDAQAKFDAVNTAIAGLDTGATVTIDATDNATTILEGVDGERKDLDGSKAEITAEVRDQATNRLEDIDSERKALDGSKAEITATVHDSATNRLEDIDGERKDLDGTKAEVVVTADVTNVQSGFRRVRQDVDDLDNKLTGGSDSSKSVMANFAGNAAQMLPGVAGAFGPLNMAISQFVEYGAEGNIHMKDLVKAIAPMGAAAAIIAIGVDVLSSLNDAEEEATRRADDFAEAFRDAGDGVEGVNNVLRAARTLLTSNDLDDSWLNELAEALPGVNEGMNDLLPVFNAAGVTMGEYSRAVNGVGTAHDDVLTALDKAVEAGLITEEQWRQGINQMALDTTAAADATSKLRGEQKFFAEDLGSATDALKDFNAEQDPMAAFGDLIIPLWKDMQDGAVDTADGVASLNEIMRLTGAENPEEVYELVTEAMGEQTDASVEAAAMRDEYIAALEEQNEALDESIEKLEEMADAQQSTGEAALDVRDAQRDVADATANYTKVMDDNESSANDQAEALDGVVRAAANSADAQTDAANATAKANGRTMTQTQLLDHNNAALLNQANSLEGPMRDAILQYIADVNGIPPSVQSDIRVALERGDIAEANRLLQETSKTRTSYVNAEADEASRRRTEEVLAFLSRSRQAVITTRSVLIGGRGYASGTPNARRGLALVGEEGPELVEMSGGEKVHSADATSRMLTAAPSSGVVNNYYYAPAGYSSRGVTNAARRYERIQGPS